jgi:predicted DNA-binding protein
MKHEPLDSQIVLRLPVQLRQRLEEVAQQEDRSLANAARRLLERSLQAVEREAAT